MVRQVEHAAVHEGRSLTQRTSPAMGQRSINKVIVMIGTAPTTKGGIAAVINAYHACGLFDIWPIVHLHSHVDGTWLQKFAAAWGAVVCFARLLWRRRVSLAHVHVASNASFWRKTVFVVLAKWAKCPIVFHIHGGGFIEFYDTAGEVPARVIRAVLNRVDCIVVLSKYWKDALSRITSNRRVIAIPNPAPPPMSGREIRTKQQLLFLGRICDDKGVFDLVRAFVYVYRLFPQATLVFAGDGASDRVRAEAESLGLGHAIRTLGWVSGQSKERLLSESSIFVLPSYAEGLPMGVLEAMSCGLAVIATRVGAVGDLIEDGVNGLLVTPGNVYELASAIGRLFADPDLVVKMGLVSQRKIAEQFAPSYVVSEIGIIYRSFGAATKDVINAVP